MKKIVGFYGSPRQGGVTSKLVGQVLAGAMSVGARVASYDLNEEDVRGCQGCYFCRKNEGCATDDKLNAMYLDIKEAQGIVAGFPIYFYDISAQSKILIDRLFPMIDHKFAPRYPGKKVITVYAQGQPDEEIYKKSIDANNKIFLGFGWEIAECLLVAGTSARNYALPQELLDKAFDMGKTLAHGE